MLLLHLPQQVLVHLFHLHPLLLLLLYLLQVQQGCPEEKKQRRPALAQGVQQ